MPCRTHFRDVIPNLYDKARKTIENDLAQTQSLALTTDSWTSRATESYLRVTVHDFAILKFSNRLLVIRDAANPGFEFGPNIGLFCGVQVLPNLGIFFH